MDYWHKPWQCPFFVWDEKRCVACEGGCRISFPDRDAAVSYMDGFCASREGGWKECSIAKMLNEFYDREEQNHGNT